MTAVLFDLDGTLTDPGDGVERSLRYALTSIGRSLPTTFDRSQAIGPPLHEVLGRLIDGASEQTIEAAVRGYRDRYDSRGWRENRVYPGVRELLRGIRELAWHAYLATSKPDPIAVHILAHFELAPYFAGIYGSGTGRNSGKADLVDRLLRQESIAPSDAVFVGDRSYDIRGARACGLDSIGVTYGYGSRRELESAGATRICGDPASVLALLQSRRAAIWPSKIARSAGRTATASPTLTSSGTRPSSSK